MKDFNSAETDFAALLDGGWGGKLFNKIFFMLNYIFILDILYIVFI